MSEALSVIERSRLEVLEDKVRENLRAFYEVGSVLIEIRDKRLYRESHKTFEEYCQKKWGMTANYARRLVAASEVVDNIKSVPMGTIPSSERQTRPLSRLSPSEQRDAWGAVVDEIPADKITAKDVARKVQELKGPPKKVDLYKNLRTKPEIMSDDFKNALEEMERVIYNESETGWKTTAHDVALKYLGMLVDMAR